VIIPHIGKGSDNLLWEDIQSANEYIYNVESKPKTFQLHKFYKDSSKSQIKPILFSDCHDWVDMRHFRWTGNYILGEFNFKKLKGEIQTIW
jgi:hypothetical protein